MHSNRFKTRRALLISLLLTLGPNGVLQVEGKQPITHHYHLTNIAWTNVQCATRVTARSAFDCATACLSSTFPCLGSTFTASSPSVCALCGDYKPPLESPDTGESNIFQMPIRSMSAPKAVELIVPYHTPAGVVYVSGVPLDGFEVTIEEPGCNGDRSNCCVDFYMFASEEDVFLGKRREATWFGHQSIKHYGLFQSERRFQMVVMMLHDIYVIIVDGVEFLKYPLEFDLSPTMNISTFHLWQVSMATSF
ncbi:hypothetical protein ElyMa_000316200 [Elysia marginata]|uniref:Galectin n=1 Tax=Elysia marginata TaxID=1093978 RepID=A0AAV4F9U3_9GAST|nr:hypothetical protein ElyMa_000316200 [Elysia marginata]